MNINISLTICGTFSVWNKNVKKQECMVRPLKPKVIPCESICKKNIKLNRVTFWYPTFVMPGQAC